ncbi:MAG: glycosyltransferase family 39 protein [Actinomycetota bacterium]|nr:glycosyltransferase family 39 protein [Actinomycetota bacterium]
MTTTAIRQSAERGGVQRGVNWLRLHWRSLATLSPLLVLAMLWQGIGMANAPQRIDDEGTYIAQAYAAQTFHSLGHYTYWYDHPPLGWIQLAGYTWLTDAFNREPNAVLAGREGMLFFQLISCLLLWVLCRRLLMARWSAGLAIALFSLSPLAVQFHRTVYLDNIATPWILAAFVLALSPRRQLWAFAAAGLAFAVAVLTKETSLLLLPAIAYLLWRNTGASGTRRYALSLATSAFVLAGGFYVLYAMVKNELVPGAHHVSLLNGVKFQLFTRQRSGSLFTPGTLSYAHLHQWLNLDSVFPALSVLALIPALAISRLRPFAVGYALLLLTMLRPGYLPVPYVIALLPLAALLVAGVTDRAVLWIPASWKTRPAKTRRVRPLLPAVLVVAIIAVGLGAPNWIAKQRGLFIGPLDQPVAQAESWIERNVPRDSRLTVDDAFWVDLVRSGFPRQNVVWYYKVDTDSAVQRLSPNGWRDYNYVVSTQSLRSNPEAAPQVAQALRNSTPYAIFGTGDTRVEVRRVIPGGIDAYRSQAKLATTNRVAATAALAHNGEIRWSSMASGQLAANQLDLRAATALATLPAAQRISVDMLPINPDEAAASMPIRTVELNGITAAQARRALAGLPANYLPTEISAHGQTGVLLAWSLGGDALIPSN